MASDNHSSPEPSSTASSPAAGYKTKHSGVTQAIRSKLAFTDESKWKRFSARRLELIDGLALSSKKASEQDEQISRVANTLREEYGFPVETLGDFDKLVRAAIQSVRRNRKRQPKGKKHIKEEPPVEATAKRLRSDVAEPANYQSYPAPGTVDNAPGTIDNTPGALNFAPANIANIAGTGEETRMSIPSLVTPSPPPPPPTANGINSERLLPPMANLTLNGFQENQLLLAAERLLSFIGPKATGGARPPESEASQPSSRNMAYLGESIIHTSAAYAVERRFVAHHDRMDLVREALLSPALMNAILQMASVSTLAYLKLILANCSRLYGFDATITSLSNFYYELLSTDANVDVTNPLALVPMVPAKFPGIKDLLAKPLPPKSYAPVVLQATVVPVTLQFMTRSLNFTYSPHNNNTPPTLAELIENSKSAFQLGADKTVQIRNASTGHALETDAEIADLFLQGAPVTLEVAVFTQHQLPSLSQLTRAASKFQPLT
ncbi:hypothetical protein TRVA0_046S00562 [Trichomonascus vanleenenianus]|uniref:uncharacterized protein n=1 Tax=Trichomonascus vanleenenianus TaxID=2268995 RepID=UPI003ECA6E56